MQSLEQRLSMANARMDELKKHKRMIAGAIETLNAKLAGTVTCPSCRHEFLVSDESFDVVGAKAELEEKQDVLDCIHDSLLDNEIEAEKVEQIKIHVRNESRNLAALRE